MQFVKENLTFTGDDSLRANPLLSVIGAFTQFKRELIREDKGKELHSRGELGGAGAESRCLRGAARRAA